MQVGEKLIGQFNAFDKGFIRGFKLYFLLYSPLGLPKWLQRITLPPFLIISWIVGKIDWSLVSSWTTPFTTGKFKSTLTRINLFFKSNLNNDDVSKENNNYKISKVGEIPLVTGGISEKIIHKNPNDEKDYKELKEFEEELKKNKDKLTPGQIGES